MSAFESIIHLVDKRPEDQRLMTYQESVTISPTQNDLDGLNALIHWCDGYEKAGKGRVPGHFELVMLYRSLAASIRSKS